MKKPKKKEINRGKYKKSHTRINKQNDIYTEIHPERKTKGDMHQMIFREENTVRYTLKSAQG